MLHPPSPLPTATSPAPQWENPPPQRVTKEASADRKGLLRAPLHAPAPALPDLPALVVPGLPADRRPWMPQAGSSAHVEPGGPPPGQIGLPVDWEVVEREGEGEALSVPRLMLSPLAAAIGIVTFVLVIAQLAFTFRSRILILLLNGCGTTQGVLQGR